MEEFVEPEIGLAHERPRDAKVDEAKEFLLEEVFGKSQERVFYGRQIEVMVERKFYHWITTQALGELVLEGDILSEKLPVRAGLEARFYWAKRVRYWKRSASGIVKLIAEYSSDVVGSALGDHGELMFDAALPRVGFMPVGWDANEYKDKSWTLTGHELDRVFIRDGVAYGAEIKNTLAYIDREELEIKLAMCEELDLKPLFIMRFAPKSYNDMIIRAGGYAMIFEWQMYPAGLEGLATRLKDELGLKVGTPRRVGDGTVGRFLTWHQKQVKGEH